MAREIEKHARPVFGLVISYGCSINKFPKVAVGQNIMKAMSHHYVVTAHKPTAVTACVTGK